MRRPRRAAPGKRGPRDWGHPGLSRESYRLLALAAAGQAPLSGSSPGVDAAGADAAGADAAAPELRERQAAVADDLSRWIDTEAGERRSPDGDGAGRSPGGGDGEG